MTLVAMLAYFLSNFIYLYAVFLFIDRFLVELKAPRFLVLFVFSVYFLVLDCLYFLPSYLFFNLLINLAFNLLACLLYRTTLAKRLLASIFVYALAIGCEDAVAVTISLVTGSSLPVSLNQPYSRLLGAILSKLLMLLIVRAINRAFQSYVQNDIHLPKSYWWAVFLVPVGSVFVMHILMVQKLSTDTSSLPIVQLSILMLLFINLAMFSLYNRLIQDEKLRLDEAIQGRMNTDYQNQIALTEDFLKNVQELKHDMKNHMLAVRSLTEQQRYAEANDYIDGLIGRIEFARTIRSGSLVIDAILNSKLYAARQSHIQVDTSIQLEDGLDMDQMDITIILGNLLDNAIEACQALPEQQRRITIQLSYRHKVLMIQIENPYLTQVVEEHGKLKSTKLHRQEHGHGLSSVNRVVEKYQGILEVDYKNCSEGGEKQFCVRAMLYL